MVTKSLKGPIMLPSLSRGSGIHPVVGPSARLCIKVLECVPAAWNLGTFPGQYPMCRMAYAYGGSYILNDSQRALGKHEIRSGHNKTVYSRRLRTLKKMKSTSSMVMLRTDDCSKVQ